MTSQISVNYFVKSVAFHNYIWPRKHLRERMVLKKCALSPQIIRTSTVIKTWNDDEKPRPVGQSRKSKHRIHMYSVLMR